MALDDNEMTLEQPESESALSSKVDVKMGRSRPKSAALCTFFTNFF